MKGRHAAALSGLMACRFGGPSDNPYAYVAFPDATAEGSDSSITTSAADGAAADGAADALGGGDDGGVSDACAPGADVAVCDPVHNTGCGALRQCDVNPLKTSMPTGRCVFGGAMREAGTCNESILTETCPPRSTCVAGECRQLCFCDGDCTAGECCSDTSGPPGFTLCGPCP